MDSWTWILSSLLSALAIYLTKRVLSYYHMCKLAKAIPGPPVHWLYGNLHQFQRDEASLLYFLKEMRSYNSTLWRGWIGPLSLNIMVVDPEVVKSWLKLPKHHFAYSLLEPWLGKGLLVAQGSQWARNRRLLTNAFHFDILKAYVAVYNECSNILISKWSIAASQGEPVLVYKSIQQLTLDIILRCSFSYNSHCQESGKPDPYINAVESLAQCVSDSFHSPLMHISRSLYMYCTPTGWKYRRALNTVHRFAEKVIKDRKLALGITGSHLNKSVNLETVRIGKNGKYLDFLDVLLTARDDDGTGLTDLEIRNEVDTFMFEGHDTTANALTWTLYMLAKYPEHQEKCREEINQVLEGREELEYEDLSKLTYTTWCIKETLRLYPPVVSTLRQVLEDTKIGGYLIPKEAIISLHIFQIHRNPKYWEDPDTFDPLRFHPDNVKDRHPYAYMPFSAGPRNCIGQNFALNEEKVIIASLVHRFSLSLVEGHKVEAQLKLLLTSSDDIKLHLKQIR